MRHNPDTSISDSSYYPHHGQFGWKVGIWMERCPKGVGEMGLGERSRKALWRRRYLTQDLPGSNSPCCTVPAGQSPGPGKCASAHGYHFGCSAQLLDGPPPGSWLLTVGPSKEQRHWHWDHLTFGEFGHLSFTCSLYQSWCFFIINSYSCLMSSRTLIRSSPGAVSTFTLTLKSFGTWCSSISCLITERENESAVTSEGWKCVNGQQFTDL